LASSLIFLGNIGLSFISRSLILLIAAVIFILLGMYLLGIFKFSHDSDLKHISVLRLLLIIASFSFSIYLLTGLNGTMLKPIEPFLPANEKAMVTAGIFPSPSAENDLKTADLLCTEKPKYSNFLHFPLGLEGYFDYNEALACAGQLNKPVLLDFAGHYCKNCKKMYAEVWSDPRVMSMLRNNFVLASLYTDDRTYLPQQDWITSTLDGKVKKTLGKKLNDLQITLFKTNALPLYAIVDSKGNVLTKEKYYTYSSSVDDFIYFLNEGITAFNMKK
jgi:thioredoxin-related protein